jgi:hypothetical protein
MPSSRFSHCGMCGEKTALDFLWILPILPLRPSLTHHLLPERRKYQIPPNLWSYLCVRLYSITFQNIVILTLRCQSGGMSLSNLTLGDVCILTCLLGCAVDMIVSSVLHTARSIRSKSSIFCNDRFLSAVTTYWFPAW